MNDYMEIDAARINAFIKEKAEKLFKVWTAGGGVITSEHLARLIYKEEQEENWRRDAHARQEGAAKRVQEEFEREREAHRTVVRVLTEQLKKEGK